jgi:outer membrane protein TolC
LVCSFQANAQSVISLDVLYDALKSHHPAHNLYDLQKSINDQQKKINKESHLPQANVTGQATWQSEVTKIPFSFPGIDIPTPPKDQYRAVLELSQSLYDGGTSKSMLKQIEEQGNLDLANTDLTIYSMKENICKAYYGAITADLAVDQLNLLIADLGQKESLLASQIKEGIASGYQSAVLKVKLMEARQSKDETIKQKQNAIQILNTLTGLHLTTDTKFNDISSSKSEPRPEYRIFDSQRKLSMAFYEVNKARFNPRVQAFSQLGYGRPGLNLLTNDFRGYSILGLRGSWNLSNLYLKHTHKEKEILQKNLGKIQVQQESFDLQQKIKTDQLKNDMANYQSVIKQDEEIIALFDTVLKSSAVRLEQGISNINEYTTDANNLAQAKIKKSIHETLLLQTTELLNLIQSKE